MVNAQLFLQSQLVPYIDYMLSQPQNLFTYQDSIPHTEHTDC